MTIVKNQKAFSLPIIVIILTIIGFTSSYFLIKNIFKEQNENNKNKIIINKEILKKNDKEEVNQEKELVDIKEEFQNNNKKLMFVDKPIAGEFIFIDTELQLSIKKEGKGIRLNWSRCNSDQFVAYKIAKSETKSDVYYPRDGSIASISNQDVLTYFDENVEENKTYYYRVCSYEKNGESWCGNVAVISL